MTHVAVVLAALDENCDGKVSWAELRRAALGEEITVQDPFAEHMRDYEEYLRMVFDRVDKNGDGELSYAELVSGLKDPDFADEAGFYGSEMSRGEFAAEFCDALNWDGDKRVVWADFRDAFLQNALDEMHERRVDQHLRRVFDGIDVDSKDYITIEDAVRGLREDEDFAEVLGFWGTHRATPEDGSLDVLCETLAAMDVNEDGVVSWREFRYAALGGEAPREAAVEAEPEPEASIEPAAELAAEPAAEPAARFHAAGDGPGAWQVRPEPVEPPGGLMGRGPQGGLRGASSPMLRRPRAW